MWEIDYGYLQSIYTPEQLALCSINERYDKEAQEVKDIRYQAIILMFILTRARDEAGRSDAWRNYSIAITNLEDSCMRAVKWFYSK